MSSVACWSADVRKLLIIAGLIIVALVVIDRVTKFVAEGQAEARIQETYGLAERPDVTVRGFPFLTQILSRELNRVDLSLDNAQVGTLTGLNVDVTARTIEIDSAATGRAEVVSGRLTLPYDSLASVARDAGATVTDLSYAGEPGLIAIAAQLDLPTGELEAVAYSVVRLEESRITVRLERIEVNGESAPPGLDLAVGDQLDFAIELPDVPGVGEITVDAVEAREDGIAVLVTGRDVAVG